MTDRHRIAPAALLCATLLAAAVTPAHADADVARTWGQDRGFSLGLKLLVDGLTIDDSDTPGQPHIDDMGSGLALVAGYTFTPHFHTRLTTGTAQHGTSVADLDVLHSMASLEAHYRFLPDRQVCPYLFGALGGSDVRADQGGSHVKISGGTAGIGTGLLVGFTRHLTLDLALRLEAVNWTNVEWSQDVPGGGTLQYQDDIEESGGSSRLEVGLLWQF